MVTIGLQRVKLKAGKKKGPLRSSISIYGSQRDVARSSYLLYNLYGSTMRAEGSNNTNAAASSLWGFSATQAVREILTGK